MADLYCGIITVVSIDYLILKCSSDALQVDYVKNLWSGSMLFHLHSFIHTVVGVGLNSTVFVPHFVHRYYIAFTVCLNEQSINQQMAV